MKSTNLFLAGLLLQAIALQAQALSCLAACDENCILFDGAEFKICQARRQACFESCNASQPSTPGSSGADYGYGGGAPFYGGDSYYGDGFGNYCCDIYGNRRCGPGRQSAPIGTPCTCAGQGNGHVCY
jgi:hypothetical protein